MSRTVFRMPDLGEGVVEGEIVEWHVEPGDTVAEDDPLVDVMTDKATVTIPSPVEGLIQSTQGKVGEMAAVGRELVVIETDADEMPSEEVLVGQAARRTALQSSETTAPSRPISASRPLASPAVRRRAREKGVDLALVSGTGHGGRITDGDVDNFLTASSPQSGSKVRAKRNGTTEVHLSGLRRRIAEKMTASNQHIPHFSYFEQVDITELAELRRYMNDSRAPDEPKLTYLPFIMLALARAFRKYPASNAHYDDQREVVTQFEPVHLGIATQTERGLYVPVVRHVESLDLREAARELRRVTQAVRHDTIRREELTGSTFTITSLGVLGGLAATPIINYPEVGILGVHKAYDRPVVRQGQIVIRHMVNLSSSFDHRVVDGADGAALVQEVKSMLEHPAIIFI